MEVKSIIFCFFFSVRSPLEFVENRPCQNVHVTAMFSSSEKEKQRSESEGTCRSVYLPSFSSYWKEKVVNSAYCCFLSGEISAAFPDQSLADMSERFKCFHLRLRGKRFFPVTLKCNDRERDNGVKNDGFSTYTSSLSPRTVAIEIQFLSMAASSH